MDCATITEVTGSRSEDAGALVAVPVKLLFTSRPEVLQVLGIGNVGARWVQADGHEWERLPRCSVERARTQWERARLPLVAA